MVYGGCLGTDIKKAANIMDLFSTLDEKIAHISLLESLAICDGNYDECENKYISALKQQYGLLDDYSRTYQDEHDIAIIMNKMTKMRNKLILLQDLLSCAYSDGIYSDNEKEKIHDVGAKLGVDVEKIEEIERLNI